MHSRWNFIQNQSWQHPAHNGIGGEVRRVGAEELGRRSPSFPGFWRWMRKRDDIQGSSFATRFSFQPELKHQGAGEDKEAEKASVSKVKRHGQCLGVFDLGETVAACQKETL